MPERPEYVTARTISVLDQAEASMREVVGWVVDHWEDPGECPNGHICLGPVSHDLSDIMDMLARSTPPECAQELTVLGNMTETAVGLLAKAEWRRRHADRPLPAPVVGGV